MRLSGAEGDTARPGSFLLEARKKPHPFPPDAGKVAWIKSNMQGAYNVQEMAAPDHYGLSHVWPSRNLTRAGNCC